MQSSWQPPRNVLGERLLGLTFLLATMSPRGGNPLPKSSCGSATVKSRPSLSCITNRSNKQQFRVPPQSICFENPTGSTTSPQQLYACPFSTLHLPVPYELCRLSLHASEQKRRDSTQDSFPMLAYCSG
jgi:hypothetical protein